MAPTREAGGAFFLRSDCAGYNGTKTFVSGDAAIHTYNLGIIGLGNVGSALIALLQRKRQELAERYGITWHITGIASRRTGWLVAHGGFAAQKLLARDFSGGWAAGHSASSLNADSGEPAITYLRTALHCGAYAISANKGPVVYAYRELTALANSKRRRFYFESAMMDGAPVFSLFRDALPAIEVRGFRGVINSTTTVILQTMEAGASLQEAIQEAQRLGVAETDPSADIDGIDAAVKVVEVANVLMGANMKLSDV